MTRQAASYRERRVLLAGDAAHVHAPNGGQGLNIGVQDAVNLGWKLAQVVKGTAPESLLDTYHAERHPIGARVLRATMAQTALSRGDARMDALRETVSDLLRMDEARKRYAGIMSGLDVHYDLGPGHPLLGRRMPDLDLSTESGSRRVFTLLHDARPVLIDLGEPGALDIGPWADRVRSAPRALRGRVGASGAGRGLGSRGGVDPARRIRRVGRRRHRPGAARCADHLVRAAQRAVAQACDDLLCRPATFDQRGELAQRHAPAELVVGGRHAARQPLVDGEEIGPGARAPGASVSVNVMVIVPSIAGSAVSNSTVQTTCSSGTSFTKRP